MFAGSAAVSDRNLKESDTSFQFCKLNVEDTLEVLQSLDVDKATSLDGISAKCLRFTAPVIAGSLNHLFNLSLTKGEIPGEWKTAKFKDGNRIDVGNYQPISSCISFSLIIAVR